MMQQLEQPKFKYNMKMYGNPRSKTNAGQKLKPLDFKNRVENSYENSTIEVSTSDVTKGKVTFK